MDPPAPARHRGSVARRHPGHPGRRRGALVTRGSGRARPRGADHRQPLLRVVDAHAHVVRGRRQAPRRRRRQREPADLERDQGRDAARHGEATSRRSGADAIVLRHAASGAARLRVGAHAHASIVNAGDGAHEHPTQALLDALHMRRHEEARSRGWWWPSAGTSCTRASPARTRCCSGRWAPRCASAGPRTLMPRAAESLGPTVRAIVRASSDAVEGADVVMMLRIQNERLAGPMLASTREYARTFGLSALGARLSRSPTPSSCTPVPSTAASRSTRASPTASAASSSTRSRPAWPCAWRCSSRWCSAGATPPPGRVA